MTNDDLDTGEAAVRKMIDTAGYGGFVSDDQCKAFAYTVIDAVDKKRSAGYVVPSAMPATLPSAPHTYFGSWRAALSYLLPR